MYTICTQGDLAARARLLRLLCPVYPEGLMWRNAKADVAADLGIPPQHALLTQLQFNAIERHWYQRQHQVRWIPDSTALRGLSRVLPLCQ